jgi:putative endonuclease
MEYKVYILHSKTMDKYYVGYSEDVNRRLDEHNIGKGNFTSKGIPWEMIKTIACTSKTEAIVLEKRIKKRGIKRYLQDNFIL